MSKKRILLIGKKGMRNPFPKSQFDVTRVPVSHFLTGLSFDLVIAPFGEMFESWMAENVIPRVNHGGSVVYGTIALDQQGAINLLSESLAVSRDLCEALRKENEDLKARLECVR